MSLYGMMRTGVSGMNAQANRLSAVSDNIANASTVGYKRASAEFSSLVLPSTAGQYNSGSVTTTIRNAISDQGGIRSTASGTDLAIDGNGYFVVSNKDGTPYLTRAGSFVKDSNGFLVNTAGYYLLGYPVSGTGQSNPIANSLDGLQKINVDQHDLVADPSKNGRFTVNLPANGAVVPADPLTGFLPADNVAGSEFSHKTSLLAHDNLGNKITLDVYFSKTADNQWNVTVYNAAEASANGGFPYSGPALVSQPMTFDGTNGSLTAGGQLTLDIPNGQTLTLDLSGTKQLAGDYTIYEAVIDGRGPSTIAGVDIGADGSVVARYEDGTQVLLYQIALGDVPSPDKMRVISGNVFAPTAESGSVRVGAPQSGSMGKINAGALEESNADIAQELTDMIEAQRSYTANSKVFQTGSELMDVLVNLKR